MSFKWRDLIRANRILVVFLLDGVRTFFRRDPVRGDVAFDALRNFDDLALVAEARQSVPTIKEKGSEGLSSRWIASVCDLRCRRRQRGARSGYRIAGTNTGWGCREVRRAASRRAMR